MLSADQILADLIYHPRQTELMRQAELRGCRVSNGLSMLIHQAAVAFEIWTGLQAPIDAMTRATEAAVSE
jgi:shikimate dehydrogenase